MDYIDIKVKNKTKYNLIYLPILLVIAIFSFQLFMLSSLGDKGEKITSLINTQNQIRTENEILKAKIMELQTNQAVIQPLAEQVTVVKKDVKVINIGSQDSLAIAK